jgi:hypothetical protein
MAFRGRIARLIEKPAHIAGSAESGREVSGRRDPDRAAVANAVEADGDTVGRQPIKRPFGPFNQGYAVYQRIIEAKFVKLVGGAETIEIEMRHRQAQRIDLDKGESRAWDLQIRLIGERANQRTRKGRFPCAEIAREA